MEDMDLRELLEENLRLAKDNNRMLRSMRRAAIASAVGKVIFWIVVLGVPAYLYVTYLAPVMSSVFPHTATSTNPILNMLGLPSTEALHQFTTTLSNLSQTAQHAFPTAK